MARTRARILGLDIRKRIKQVRTLSGATSGKCILDCPGEMIEMRLLAKQLADDAEIVLDALMAEHEGT